jgi:hypothetical protein
MKGIYSAYSAYLLRERLNNKVKKSSSQPGGERDVFSQALTSEFSLLVSLLDDMGTQIELR